MYTTTQFSDAVKAELYPAIGRVRITEAGALNMAEDIGHSFSGGLTYLVCQMLDNEYEINNPVNIAILSGECCEKDRFAVVETKVSYSKLSWFVQIACPNTKRMIRFTLSSVSLTIFFELFDNVEYVDEGDFKGYLVSKGESIQVGQFPCVSLPTARVGLYFQQFLVHGISDPSELTFLETSLH